MAELGSGVSDGAFVEVQEGFADDAEVEATGEALGSEGVVEERGELAVEPMEKRKARERLKI